MFKINEISIQISLIEEARKYLKVYGQKSVFSAIVHWQLLFCSNIIIPFFPSRNKSAGGIISIASNKSH